MSMSTGTSILIIWLAVREGIIKVLRWKTAYKWEYLRTIATHVYVYICYHHVSVHTFRMYGYILMVRLSFVVRIVEFVRDCPSKTFCPSHLLANHYRHFLTNHHQSYLSIYCP